MLPRIFGQMLFGRALETRRPRRRPHRERIEWQPTTPPPERRQGELSHVVRHGLLEGAFVVVDLDPPDPASAPLDIQPVDPQVGEQLADELRQLIDEPPTQK